MNKHSLHTQAVGRAMDDMRKAIDSMGNEQPFMVDPKSSEAKSREKTFASMAPDLKVLLDGGMPAYLVEKLARADMES